MQTQKLVLASLFVAAVIAVALVWLFHSSPKAPSPVQQAVVIPTPTATPLTQENADAAFNQEDQDLQQSLNQVDVDLQSLDQIDTSKDSTAGL